MGKNKGIGFGLLSDFGIGECLSTWADQDGRNKHERLHQRHGDADKLSCLSSENELRRLRGVGVRLRPIASANRVFGRFAYG